MNETESTSSLTIAPPAAEGDQPEQIAYLLVTDTSLEVLKGGVGNEGLSECRKLAGVVRRAGGAVTIFKSLKF